MNDLCFLSQTLQYIQAKIVGREVQPQDEQRKNKLEPKWCKLYNKLHGQIKLKGQELSERC